MNRYLMISRLKGPAYLILIGFMFLLSEAHILPWGKSWPLLLILAGVLYLAERAALTQDSSMYPPRGYPPNYTGYSGPGYTGPGYQGYPGAAPVAPPPSTPPQENAQKTAEPDSKEWGHQG